MEDYLVGIDFGACNLKAAAFKGKKLASIQLNTDESGIKYTRNIIYYRGKKDKDGNIEKIEKIIGQRAFNFSLPEIGNEKNFVANVKRKLEIANWSQRIACLDRDVTAVEVIRDIFGCIQSYFKNKKDQSVRAILTVPVCFSNIQRNEIRRAAEDAGILVDSLISEPFAALFSLKDLPSYKDKLIMIFDFGGSTLDISVAKIECPDENALKITEIAAAGIHLGGLDIDRDIYQKILLRDFKTDFDNAIKNDLIREEKFLEFTHVMKENLFKENDDTYKAENLRESSMIPGLEEVTLNRKDIYKMFSESDYKQRIFDMFDAIFEDLEETDEFYQKEDIAKIFPFGGTCKIPFFIDALEEYFGAEVFNKQDFDFSDNEFLIKGLEDRYLAVASGAVHYLKSKQSNKVEILNVIPYCIGYGKDGKFMRCISRNMPFGYETRSMLLPLSFLEKISWKLPIYQCFNNQTGQELDKEESATVYMGNIDLDESLYEKQESPVFTMRVMRDGRLRMQFFDNKTFPDGSKELVQTEEKFLEIGG